MYVCLSVRQRKRDRQTDRQTERQRDRETERQRNRETERQRDRKFVFFFFLGKNNHSEDLH